MVSAGNDGSGALTAIERIARGYPLQRAIEPIVAKGEPTDDALQRCFDMGQTMAPGLPMACSDAMVATPAATGAAAAGQRLVGVHRRMRRRQPVHRHRLVAGERTLRHNSGKWRTLHPQPVAGAAGLPRILVRTNPARWKRELAIMPAAGAESLLLQSPEPNP